MKPIQTQYAGCFFRSRTEARWAVFFDALKWDWKFEEEGYELKTGRYLPDFKIWPHGGEPRWFEVKPFSPHCPIDPRWTELAQSSGMSLFAAYGMHRSGDRCEEAWADNKTLRAHAGRLFTPDGRDHFIGPYWTEERYEHAWNAASGSRFEFGESGPTR